VPWFKVRPSPSQIKFEAGENAANSRLGIDRSGKLEKVWEFVWSGKVMDNDLRSCRLQTSVIFCVSKY